MPLTRGQFAHVDTQMQQRMQMLQEMKSEPDQMTAELREVKATHE